MTRRCKTRAAAVYYLEMLNPEDPMPLITELSLDNFRNFERAEFRFSGNDVLLIGPNGSGKSNLLESIGILSILRSFRGAGIRETVRIGEKGFTLRGRIDTGRYPEELLVRDYRTAPRELFIDGRRISRASEFIREFRTVVFAPEDRELAAGSAGCRRRYFDMMISAVDPGYLSALSRYDRALSQRNRALKSSAPQRIAAIRAFEPELASMLPVIVSARERYARTVENEVNRLFGDKAQFGVRYAPDAGADAETHLKRLAAEREKDLLRGITGSGPQRDDFEFMLNGRRLRGFGSTGQLRLATLLLKLAEFSVIRGNSSARVAVLADDVTGELDATNRELFFSVIAAADQRFYTFTEVPDYPGLRGAEVIRLAPTPGKTREPEPESGEKQISS